MDNCKYILNIPNIGTCCVAYSKSKRKDGFHWAHYPNCKLENCPLLHPELLDDAVLETEE
jgi:hypothetical protein